MVERRSPWLLNLPSWLGANTVIALFALAPWLLAGWPLQWLGRALARVDARKWLSELMVLFTAVWAISLLTQALTSASSRGLFGLGMLLPLLWVPLAMAASLALARRRIAPRGRPPTLLVLRVFQHDAQMQALFHHVIERWRLTGNTVLIAGTDLADRTLGADDIFTFLDGGLAQRFIHTPADVAPRLARVVVLTDAQTDQAAATAAAAGAPPDRFDWLDVARVARTGARERLAVLQSLFVSAPSAVARPLPTNQCGVAHCTAHKTASLPPWPRYKSSQCHGALLRFVPCHAGKSVGDGQVPGISSRRCRGARNRSPEGGHTE